MTSGTRSELLRTLCPDAGERGDLLSFAWTYLGGMATQFLWPLALLLLFYVPVMYDIQEQAKQRDEARARDAEMLARAAAVLARDAGRGRGRARSRG